MFEATVIYPHQLFSAHPAVSVGRTIYLVEESLILTRNPIHRQKLIFHKLSLDAYQAKLESGGHQVIRLTISEYPTTKTVFERLKADKITTLHVVDTSDTYLEQSLAACDLVRVWYESPLFILDKADAMKRFVDSKRFMASFYKQLRRDKNILVNAAGEPMGGQWSFDEDNRKKLPKGAELPPDIDYYKNAEIDAAIAWSKTVPAEMYGEAGCWLPYTHTDAHTFLQEFMRIRFNHFGTYEDAISTRGTRLFHSTLSPLLNSGLLTPTEVLETILEYARTHDIAINSLEGFVRQILGWREFMRASYECDGVMMRNKNFFNHTRELPQSFWDGTTGLLPVDHSIATALRSGYTHHIERLMVLGNSMLLCGIQPDEVYRWFMGMYVDAYDWVMVPNVYGMSQFSDGGSFATKPYISGSNYLKKMSDFPSGDWEHIWTALYWQFIATHH
ncbi:MAG: cryptochrome/photolyase family protein, partial [Bacteroidota bacterium]